MKKTVFKGAATAIITPFDKKGIDWKSFEKLIEFQISNGIDAIVVCGTTGEAPTLTDKEHKKIIDFAIEKIDGRVPVIAGTGSNDTSHAVSFSEYAYKAGADAVLTVTPYYNKTTQDGLYSSFKEIASSVDIPVILYNVPSRTGCNIEINTYKRLAEIDNIVAVKEASGNINQIQNIISECGDKLNIYSGNDDQTYQILSMGGLGIISVLSNIAPAQTKQICQLYFDGKHEESFQKQLEYLPLIHALFSQVNPIPVKTAAKFMGLCSGELRLPLVKMKESDENNLYKILTKYKLIR